MSPDPHEVYALAYEEAKLALERQANFVESLRNRAGLLLSAAAIATSFLGGAALASGPRPLSWLAIACFAVLGFAIALVLWPERLIFEVDPEEILATFVEGGKIHPLDVVLRELALHRARLLERNGRRAARGVAALRVATVLLIAEIVAWIADLALA